MIYIKRFLWALGWIPVFTLGIILGFANMLLFPLICLFYYIKNGDAETTPDKYYALTKLGWHPASELPVIPEGKNWVKVVALVDFGDNTLRPRHEIYKDKGWSKKDMWTVKYWCYPPEEDKE